MFEVEIFCDSSITDSEREMIINAARLAAPLYGCGFRIHGEGEWNEITDDSIPKSCNEIISGASVNRKGQKNASSILDHMCEVLKAREKTGAMIIYTGEDLFLKKSWCFGAARVGGRVSVQSMRRFRDLSDEDKQAVVTRTLRHEVGHIHKCAADPKRKNTEQKHGMHCTMAGCTMRQTLSLKDLLIAARDEDSADCLCSLCREDLERFKKDYY